MAALASAAGAVAFTSQALATVHGSASANAAQQQSSLAVKRSFTAGASSLVGSLSSLEPPCACICIGIACDG